MIISYKQAIQKGLKQYFTGEECKNGHVSTRFVASKRCSKCQSKNNKQTKRELIYKALVSYGGCCQNCGIQDWTLLNFHHRKGGGTQEDFYKMCRRMVANGIEKDRYQLLCANCHIRADIRDGTNKRGLRFRRLQKMYGFYPDKEKSLTPMKLFRYILDKF